MAITTDLVEAFLKYSTKCGSDSFCSEAETEARARSHFQRVLHDESGQNWRGQMAERSDASLTEVLSKLTRVPASSGYSLQSRVRDSARPIGPHPLQLLHASVRVTLGLADVGQ
jgi:hypothetical protein